MSNRPQPADASDALMTELATIPNHLGFVVFDHAGKKVCDCGMLSAMWWFNVIFSWQHQASWRVRTLSHS
jgi:hypothetical protein